MNAATAVMDAQRSANKMLQSIWGARGFPIDPVWIAGKLGVTVIETELPASVLGGLVKDQHRAAVIVINRLDIQSHKRLNCAHKIGHYAEHLMQANDFYKYLDLGAEPSGIDPIEIFAHRFGLELLMPEDEIKRLDSAGQSTPLMAQHFGVTEDVMQERLNEADLCV